MTTQYSDLEKHFESQIYLVQRILNEFKKPIFQNIFFQNISALKQNADKVEFSDNTWHQRPEKFCLDYYNEPYLFMVILLINNIKSIFSFKIDNFSDRMIIAPKKSKISKIVSYIKD